MFFILLIAVLFGMKSTSEQNQDIIVDTDMYIYSKDSKHKFYEDLWGYREPCEDWSIEYKTYLEFTHATNLVRPSQHQQYTQTGYFLTNTPLHIHKSILEFRDSGDHVWQQECPSYVDCKKAQNVTEIFNRNEKLTMLITSPQLLDEIFDVLQPILENWSGISLKRSIVYGIRRYERGSSLPFHVDHAETHVISAILQIDQNVDEPWPLNIITLQGEKKSIYLNPGQMILYESAKMLHGRQYPLNGTYYDNLFVHF